MANKFDLEYQYQLYLQRVGLDESLMHQVQKKETKQAFYGACGQILILLRDDLSTLDEKKAMNAFQNLYNQVSNYFLNTTKQLN